MIDIGIVIANSKLKIIELVFAIINQIVYGKKASWYAFNTSNFKL